MSEIGDVLDQLLRERDAAMCECRRLQLLDAEIAQERDEYVQVARMLASRLEMYWGSEQMASLYEKHPKLKEKP